MCGRFLDYKQTWLRECIDIADWQLRIGDCTQPKMCRTKIGHRLTDGKQSKTRWEGIVLLVFSHLSVQICIIGFCLWLCLGC